MVYVTKRQRAEIRKKKVRRFIISLLVISLLVAIVTISIRLYVSSKINGSKEKLDIPAYSGNPYCIIHDNVPFFTEEDKRRATFEYYSELDRFGRCGTAFANISRELMPTEERGEIGNIKPSGWVQAKYEGIIDSKPPYLYNRCHLIAYCLTAENANEKNLITGTRYMNIEGMLPFEERVAKYLDKNDNHVLYRVTPVYEGSNLVANGVLMEAYSVEDNGEGISFCVFCYNVQPGVIIDYFSGESKPQKNK